MFPFLLLISIFITISIWGAGIFPGATYILCGSLVLGVFFLSSFRISNSSVFLFSPPLYFSIVILVLITCLPLPPISESIIFGSVRKQQNDLVKTKLKDASYLGMINEDSNAGFSLSRNRVGTIRFLIYILAIFAALTLSSSMEKKWKTRMIRFLLYFTASIALLGYLGQHIFPQGRKIWWLFSIGWGNPVACFVNRSHFGGFVALTIPLAILTCTRDFSHRKWLQGSLGFLSFCVMSLAVVSSMSRGAFMVYLFSLLMVGIVTLRRQNRIVGILTTIIVCLMFVVLGKILTEKMDSRLQTLKELESDESTLGRISIWKDGIHAWYDYPFIGAGADAFRVIFPQYNRTPTTGLIVHAENLYLQLLINGGILGVVLFGGLLMKYLKATWNTFLDNKEIVVGAWCALFGAGIHAFVDMAPSIPLYGLTLSVLVGLSIEGNPRFVTSSTPQRSGGSARMFGLFGMTILLIFYLNLKLDVYKMDTRYFLANSNPETLKKALVFAPTSWQAWYHLGRFGLEVNDPKYNQFAEACFAQAAEYNPKNYFIWQQLSAVRTILGNQQEADFARGKMRENLPNAVLQKRKRAQRNYLKRRKDRLRKNLKK